MKKILIAFASLVISGALLAAPVCKVPKEKWIKEADIKLSLWKQGYTIKTFKISNGCYAIDGLDRSGNRFEIYLDPATGDPLDE